MVSMETLEELSDKTLFLRLAKNWFLKRDISHIIIVRNPYDRLVSFYFDKFIKHPKTFRDPKFGGWQKCQEIFFESLNIHDKTENREVAVKFNETTFPDFIRGVEKVYKKDGHLHPQSGSLRLNLARFLRIKLRKFEICKIEGLDDAYGKTRLGIDIQRQQNKTEHGSYSEYFDHMSYEIVNRLYREDFLRFGYAMDIAGGAE